MANPFDILPLNLFITHGDVSLQRHYMAILLRIYALAEFNRFGLAREVVLSEIMDYLRGANAEAETNEVDADVHSTIQHLLKRGLKLEQEAIQICCYMFNVRRPDH